MKIHRLAHMFPSNLKEVTFYVYEEPGNRDTVGVHFTFNEDVEKEQMHEDLTLIAAENVELALSFHKSKDDYRFYINLKNDKARVIWEYFVTKRNYQRIS